MHRLLKRDLGAQVSRTERGSWVTTSSLPHEIQIQRVAGIDFVRVSAGAVVNVRETRALLSAMNELNLARALIKLMWMDRKVLAVTERPLASLKRGDLEEMVSTVMCCTRLDAEFLATHGGRPTTSPPAALGPDLQSEAECMSDLYRFSGTATERELLVWIEDMCGIDCWMDSGSFEEGPVFGIGTNGMVMDWPFNFFKLFLDVEEHKREYGDDDDE